MIEDEKRNFLLNPKFRIAKIIDHCDVITHGQQRLLRIITKGDKRPAAWMLTPEQNVFLPVLNSRILPFKGKESE